MARTWYSVTVELLGGRDYEPWPWPGRILAVGPSHTFMDLADAINDAFARWDRSHLSVFTLADGRMVTDRETGAEMENSMAGPLVESVDIDTAKVTRTVGLGEEFQFTFDLGDEWVHRCVVAEAKIDPVEELGTRPAKPLPSWGWGSIPDQYGRRWADDDGEGRIPPRPSGPHPMITHAWPAADRLPGLDVVGLRQAAAARDADGVLAAIRGREIDDALQHVVAGLGPVLARGREEDMPTAFSIVNRLSRRNGPGDRELAEDLLARLRGEPPRGREAPVDLEMLSMVLEGDPGNSTGGFVDLQTGDVASDEMLGWGDDGFPTPRAPDADPDRWLRVDMTGSRDGWRDMADFAARQRDEALRERLERALEGKGAFRRFGDLVHGEGLGAQWNLFSDDRRLGRARAFLAEAGVRVGIAGTKHGLS